MLVVKLEMYIRLIHGRDKIFNIKHTEMKNNMRRNSDRSTFITNSSVAEIIQIV